MNQRVATCACGQLQITCRGEPDKVSLCHCLQCQRRTGGPFGVAVFYPRDRVGAAGEATVFRRLSDSGFDVSFRFCPACGSTVFWEAHRKPDVIAVALGAFADRDFTGPSQVVYGDHRHRWLRDSPP
jgi:hypothetical protein